MSNLVKNIKDLCAKRSITVSKMERDVGLSPRYVYKWTTSVPTVDKLKSVADYFGVSMDYLMKPDFVEQLGKLMEGNGVNVAELAETSGVHPQRITDLMNGEEPTKDELHLISDALNVDPTYFADIQMQNQRSEEMEINRLLRDMDDEKLHTVFVLVKAIASEK